MNVITKVNGVEIGRTSRTERKPNYVIGVDLGQTTDYTAISIVEIPESKRFNVIHLERMQLGTPYPQQVQHVKRLYDLVSKKGVTKLVVDKTGCGRPVVDQMVENGLAPIGISITAGNQDTREGLEWHIPKRDLIQSLVVAYQNYEVTVAAELPHATTLESELLNFTMKVSTAGKDTYGEWREGIHDDLVLSLAMAIYVSRQSSEPCVLVRSNAPSKYMADCQGIDPFTLHRRKYR